LILLWLGGGNAADARVFAFGAAGLALILAGEASIWLGLLALLPLLQLASGPPPPELADAMIAAGVTGPGTIAADPAALWSETLTLAGCVGAFALARTAARLSPRATWLAAGAVAAFGCFEAAAGTLVNRGQLAALLELTFGVGCGLIAASWSGRSWRERFEDRALLGGLLGSAAIICSLGGIVLSLSRTGIAVGGLEAVVSGLWLTRRRRGVAAAAALALVAVALAAAPKLERAYDRFEQLAAERGDPGRSAVWRDSFDLARGHWATGVGLGSFPSAFRRSSVYLLRKSVEAAHSDYLEWFVELGALGGVLLTGSVLLCFLASARRAGDSPLALGCLLGVGGTLLHATVDLPLQLPGLAALAGAVLGLASGNPTLTGGALKERTMRAAGVILAVALVIVTVEVHFQIETPEMLYQAAGEASARGDLEHAARLYRRALDRNLLTAPAWLRLAEIERGAGNTERARVFFEAARSVEPFTLRTEWPLAELELASGDLPSGIDRLVPLIAAAPDLLDAALHTAWRSGADAEQLEQIVPRDDAESAGRYLAFLARNGLPDRLPEAYARLGSPDLPKSYRDWLARNAGFQP
jgi:O-antigen ligase